MAPLETFSLNGRMEENQRLFSVGDLGLKNLDFASESPLLPLTGKAPPLRSVSGQLLTIFGRRLVKVDSEGQSCLLHFYVCDVPYCVVV